MRTLLIAIALFVSFLDVGAAFAESCKPPQTMVCNTWEDRCERSDNKDCAKYAKDGTCQRYSRRQRCKPACVHHTCQ
jgi:hypothetical protein